MPRTLIAAVMLAAVLSLAGCHSGKTAAGASSLAANPTVSADASQAAHLLGACVNAGSRHAVESCLQTKVPSAKRQALLTCLATSYTRDSGYTHVGYTTWKQSGVQPCIQAALQ